VQARERRWMGLRAGKGHEVDVVDREILVSIDEVDEAVAGAVDSRDVQFHRGSARGHLPRAEVKGAPEGLARVAHAQRATAASVGVCSVAECALTIRFIVPCR
jgi:hypothetical protein